MNFNLLAAEAAGSCPFFLSLLCPSNAQDPTRPVLELLVFNEIRVVAVGTYKGYLSVYSLSGSLIHRQSMKGGTKDDPKTHPQRRFLLSWLKYLFVLLTLIFSYRICCQSQRVIVERVYFNKAITGINASSIDVTLGDDAVILAFRFQGHIPEELGALNSHHLLNLSHNSLTRQIPSSLGKITELESLDLSSNKLDGRIPEELTSLTFLSVLKLSHNKLEGDIPQGKQFNTFSNDSYIVNSGLCGFPLTKKCHKEEEPGAPPSKFDEEGDSAALFEWKFTLVGYGCGLVLRLSLGYIVFTTGTLWWVMKKVEKYQQKFVGRCTRRQKKRKTQKHNQRS
ncbi:hypothetical protein SLEP1_g55951 [Rubroshorea leprosula]|uniref:Uncharacterized protein n=1 Tax=Rubroshorea leprosula TaxID=152421 RepID=A0AAV5MI66_9ROSI|nr:hypothetical protein SLEP1_g55951 [Rubroshorea leprosula]